MGGKPRLRQRRAGRQSKVSEAADHRESVLFTEDVFIIFSVHCISYLNSVENLRFVQVGIFFEYKQ